MSADGQCSPWDAMPWITSLQETSATASGNTLTFLNRPVNIDPVAYLGQWRFNGASDNQVGFQTLVVVPDGAYRVVIGDLAHNFIMEMDADGNVTSLQETSATEAHRLLPSQRDAVP